MWPFLYLLDNRECPVESVTREGRKVRKVPEQFHGRFFKRIEGG